MVLFTPAKGGQAHSSLTLHLAQMAVPTFSRDGRREKGSIFSPDGGIGRRVGLKHQ